jgi:hypothetical protein
MRNSRGGLPAFPPERETADVIVRSPDRRAGTLPGKTSDTLRRYDIPPTATAPGGRDRRTNHERPWKGEFSET